jgi:SAM-dependent methyltransferase
MLARAAERVEALGLANARLELADAATYGFAPGSADLVFSRFGVMFFEDPAGAFGNIRGALAPGGRLVFACWQRLADNPWFAVPIAAARAHLPPQPPADPDAPGPFAFADPERVRGILASAGFGVVRIEPHETAMRLGGPGDLERMVDGAVEMGPVLRLLAGADDAARATVRAAVRDALASHMKPDGVTLPGSVWFVAATA